MIAAGSVREAVEEGESSSSFVLVLVLGAKRSLLTKLHEWRTSIIMRYAFLTTLALLTMVVSALPAEEKDILDIVKENPSRDPGRHVAIEYGGDTWLEIAVHGLGGVGRPWTYSKIIDLYHEQLSQRSKMIQDRSSLEKKEEFEKVEKQCGYLATLLAASRDPRAAIELMKSWHRPGVYGFVEASIDNGLHRYFVDDTKYKQSPMRRIASTNIGPELDEQLRNWWKLNREEIEVAAKGLSD